LSFQLAGLCAVDGCHGSADYLLVLEVEDAAAITIITHIPVCRAHARGSK